MSAIITPVPAATPEEDVGAEIYGGVTRSDNPDILELEQG